MSLNQAGNHFVTYTYQDPWHNTIMAHNGFWPAPGHRVDNGPGFTRPMPSPCLPCARVHDSAHAQRGLRNRSSGGPGP